MATTPVCRLCITSCHEFKRLFDDNEELTEVYKIVAKYFHSRLLKLGKEHTTSVICSDCWKHIFDFHTFQQSVVDSQSKLEHAETIETVSKKPSAISVFDIIHINSGESQETSIDAVSDTQKSVISATTLEISKDPKPAIKNKLSSDLHRMDIFIANTVGELECTLCKKTFANHLLLNIHYDEAHPHHECSEICCGHVFNKRFKLVRHLRQIHQMQDKYPYKCELCRVPFIELSALKIHYRKVHNQNDMYAFICKTCGETFRHGTSLLKHINRKHKNPPNIFQLVCNDCNRLFKCLPSYENHMKNKHKGTTENSGPQLFCSVCNKIFKAGSPFISHMENDHPNIQLTNHLISYLRLIDQHHQKLSKDNSQKEGITNEKLICIYTVSNGIIEVMSDDSQEE